MSDRAKEEFEAWHSEQVSRLFEHGESTAASVWAGFKSLLEITWKASRANTAPQPIYDEAAEQEAFEAVNPMPDQVTKFKGGYAPTGYSAWDAQDFCKKWDGWKQCAQSRAKAGEDER